MTEKAGEMLFDDNLSREDDRQPNETLLATFGLDNSMRSGGVIIMVLMYFGGCLFGCGDDEFWVLGRPSLIGG